MDLQILEEKIKKIETRVAKLESRDIASAKSVNLYLIPLAVIIAGAVIAFAVVMTGGAAPGQQTAQVSPEEQEEQVQPKQEEPKSILDNLRPISERDHIKGNPDAAVKLVEFSDTECPFCKRFYDTTQQLFSEYGASGQVAIIFRHFPLESLHSKAPKEAQAAECAWELGGNDAFWAYLDRIFEITPSNNQLDLQELPRIAEYAGLDTVKFQECLNSTRHLQRLQEDMEDGINSGVEGVPFSIVIAPNGQKFAVNGAQPYTVVKQTIDNALNLK